MKQLLSRLRQIASYAPDWDGYGAEAISVRAITTAEQFLQSETLESIAPTYEGTVDPLHNGGVRIAWATTNPEAEDDAYVELTIAPEGQIHWLGVRGEDTFEFDVSVDAALVHTVETLV